MKNIFKTLAAVALIAMTASCSKDGAIAPAVDGEEVNATFSVQLPGGIVGRATNDGTMAKYLNYAVYEAGNANERGVLLGQLTTEDVEIQGGAWNVSIPLVADQSYDIVFWAQAENAPYDIDWDAKTIAMDYTNGEAGSNEKRDAFFAVVDNLEIKGATQKNVTLKRPFAQLNIGLTEGQIAAAKQAGFALQYVTVKAKANSTFNFSQNEGKAEGETLVEFAPALHTLPVRVVGGVEEHTIVVNEKTYDWVSFNYLLTDAELIDVEVKFANNDATKNIELPVFTNVPIERNHRTNIVGDLLTDPANFDVTINPGFEDENNVTAPLYTVVKNAEEFYAAFANEEIEIIVLGNDIVIGESATRADNPKLTVSAGKAVTINLDGHKLSTTSAQAGKSYNMFDVRGTLTVKNGEIEYEHVGENMGWSYFTEIFYVAFNGTLNLENVVAKNLGGSDMAYVIDMVNATNVNVNVKNSTLVSPYIPIRVFNNNASGVHNVTVKGSTLQGKYCFWVQYYTADGRDEATLQQTLKLDIFNEEGVVNNKFKATNNKEQAPVIYGFNETVYVNQYGQVFTPRETAAIGVIKEDEENYVIIAEEGLASISELIAADGDGFAGKTIKLEKNVDLTAVKTNGDSFAPIGSTGERDSRGRLVCEAFKGTFDGNGKTIKGIYQSGWDMGYEWGQYGSIGLFAELEGATVKNVTIEAMEAQVEGGDISFIAGSATGDCVFENITIKNSGIGTYNNGCGGIIGWSGAGTYTFKNITIGEDVVLGGLWGSFDSSIGGVVGQAEPGATYNFENVTINCRIDAYNDCTASYDYYNYRMCGMVIGRCEETTTIDGKNYPDLSKYNLSFNNVVVNYGDWMNYHYCRKSGERAARVEPGFAYGGIAADRDHSTDNVHCMSCIPFDQLIGGDQYGVKGLREVNGITVNYPASYRREVGSAAALTEALGKGLSVVLGDDVDFGSTQLAVTGENQVVDLGGHALTTANNWGGISLKNGATIKNGTITHAGNTAAIKAFNGTTIENVTINATCQTADKTVTGIAVQQGANVECIKDVTINGVSQGIEVGYQATVGLIENAVVEEHTNGTAKGIGLVINGGKVGKAKNCSFKGDVYGITMHLKGVFAVGLELENCQVEGQTASIYAWDEKGVSNTSGSLVLTYDAATTLTGDLIWDFEEECQSVVTLNRPQ